MSENHNNLCYNCFAHTESSSVCSVCGFNNQNANDSFPLALKCGSILNGRYVLGRVLGQGGFGITYIAFDNDTNTKVAIKEYVPMQISTRLQSTTLLQVSSATYEQQYIQGMRSFLEEAQTLARFNAHPNIVSVKSYFEENSTAYFVMEYIEGNSFKNIIKAKGGKLKYDEVLAVLLPVMDALDTAHKENLLHRDVTPDNIYVTKNLNVKLLDFGSSRFVSSEQSRSLDVILKAGYAPKEQYIRRGKQGPYTDIYSLGACFYASITGVLPPESLERLDEDNIITISTRGIKIPDNIEDAIMKALEVHAADRFQNIAEFKAALSANSTQNSALTNNSPRVWDNGKYNTVIENVTPPPEPPITNSSDTNVSRQQPVAYTANSATIITASTNMNGQQPEAHTVNTANSIPYNPNTHESVQYNNYSQPIVNTVAKKPPSKAILLIITFVILGILFIIGISTGADNKLPSEDVLNQNTDGNLPSTDDNPLSVQSRDTIDTVDTVTDGVTWNDPTMEKMVRMALDKPTGGITQEDLNGITELVILGESYAHIGGGLSEVVAGKYSFSYTHSEDGSVSSETAAFGNLSDISDLEKMPNLDVLFLAFNKVQDISILSQLKNLSVLFIPFNSIENVDTLLELENLEAVVLQGNYIIDFSPVEHLSFHGEHEQRYGTETPASALTTLFGNNNEMSSAQLEADISLIMAETPTENILDMYEYAYRQKPDTTIKEQINDIKAQLYDTDNTTAVTFEDATMESMVRLALNKPRGSITQGELNAITELYVLGDSYASTEQKLLNVYVASDEIIYTYRENEQGYLGETTYGSLSNISDLAKMPNLKILYINCNSISDISVLQSLGKLQIVQLQHNNISNIDALANLSDLNIVELLNNPVSDWTPVAHVAHVGK